VTLLQKWDFLQWSQPYPNEDKNGICNPRRLQSAPLAPRFPFKTVPRKRMGQTLKKYRGLPKDPSSASSQSRKQHLPLSTTSFILDINRRLQVTSVLTKQLRQIRKDFRQTRRSSIITSATRTPTPSLCSKAARAGSDSFSEPPLMCEIYVDHYHGHNMVHEQLNDRPTPIIGSTAYYNNGE